MRESPVHSPFSPQSNKMQLKLSIVISLIIVFSPIKSEEHTVFGKLKSGFQLAGRLLGIDQANGVAQLVTQAFGKNHDPKGDAGEGPKNIFSSFLRVLGFDAKKIGAIAVNAIIFVAQLISSSLAHPKILSQSEVTEARTIKEGSPFDWMMSSNRVISMFSHIKDKDLPEKIVLYVKEKSSEETDCLQLLICKGAPFVWGMQKALDHGVNASVKGGYTLNTYLPSLEEVIDHGLRCEEKHPFCIIDS